VGEQKEVQRLTLKILFSFLVLAVLINGGCKPANDATSANTKDPAAIQPASATGSPAATQPANQSNQPDDKTAIQTVVNQAVVDLANAINQRDYSRLDKYFDLSDATVKARLNQQKQILRKQTASSQQQLQGVTISNVEVTNLKIHDNSADAIVIATVNGSLRNDRQRIVISQPQTQKIKLRKTDQGWRIIDAVYEER
jgi:hypothetical protein